MAVLHKQYGSVLSYIMDYESSANVVYRCSYHVIWSPKYRRHILCGNVAERLKDMLLDTADRIQATLDELEVLKTNIQNQNRVA